MAESGYISNAYADIILNCVTQNTAIATQAHVHLRLWETLPGRDGTGGTECSYTGYGTGITALTGASSVWDAPVTESGRRVVKNTSDLVFTPNTSGATVSIAGLTIHNETNTTLLWIVPGAISIDNYEGVTISAGALVLGFEATSNLTYEMQDRVLNVCFRNTAVPVLTGLIAQLQTTVTGKDGTGGVAASYTGYADAIVDCGAASEWDAPAAYSGYRSCANSVDVTFGKNTGSLQSVIGICLLDDQVVDVPLFILTFGAPEAVAKNHLPTAVAGAMNIIF